MALTTLDFPTPAYPVITTLCPFLRTQVFLIALESSLNYFPRCSSLWAFPKRSLARGPLTTQ